MDLEDVPEEVREEIEFVFIETIADAVQAALEPKQKRQRRSTRTPSKRKVTKTQPKTSQPKTRQRGSKRSTKEDGNSK